MDAMMMGVGGCNCPGHLQYNYTHEKWPRHTADILVLHLRASWGPGGHWAARERTLLLSLLGSFINSVPINFVNPYAQAAIGGQITFIYGSFSVAAMVFVYFYLPETKDRSLEELDEMFQNNVATRKFASYTCTGLGSQ
jgi:hypothetical protein